MTGGEGVDGTTGATYKRKAGRRYRRVVVDPLSDIGPRPEISSQENVSQETQDEGQYLQVVPSLTHYYGCSLSQATYARRLFRENDPFMYSHHKRD
jgi:hypothetical protein